MGAVASTSPETQDRDQRPVLALVLGLVGVVLLVATIALVAVQIEVTDDDVAATRACGSVIDGVTDRSGWETWWVQDLDEPETAVRASLVRTAKCPAAVNARIVLAAALGAVGVSALATGMWIRRRHDHTRPSDDVAGRLARLGRVTSAVGGGLTLLGLAGIGMLLADADSTLFLYTDRTVVAVVGLIVLVPAIALFAAGRALALAARSGAQTWPPEREDHHA